MPELKPCPFCGGEARISHNMTGSDSWVICSSCYVYCPADTSREFTEAEAIDAWNTRVKPGDDKSLTDEEREILDDMPALKRLAMIAGFEVER